MQDKSFVTYQGSTTVWKLKLEVLKPLQRLPNFPPSVVELLNILNYTTHISCRQERSDPNL